MKKKKKERTERQVLRSARSPAYRPRPILFLIAVIRRPAISCFFRQRVITKTIVREIVLITGPAAASDRRARLFLQWKRSILRVAQLIGVTSRVNSRQRRGKKRRDGFVPGLENVRVCACVCVESANNIISQLRPRIPPLTPNWAAVCATA